MLLFLFSSSPLLLPRWSSESCYSKASLRNSTWLPSVPPPKYPWIPVLPNSGSVMAHRDWARQKSWTKPTQIASIKRVPTYFMLSWRPRTYSFMVPMCQMLLPSPPPPKQGFYIHPDWEFREWWSNHKKRPPISEGKVMPILSAMQGHPEYPRLWEKHADAILHDCGLIPTGHQLL